MAGLSCGAQCAKILLFVFNALFFLSGALLLGVGIWLKVDPNVNNFFKIAENDSSFNAAAILLIVVGALIFVVGFFGCCGACKENSCMLCTFVVFLCIIFVVEIAAAVLAAVYRNELGSVLEKAMVEQAQTKVLNEYSANSTGSNLAWQRMQMELKCCGGAGYMDYRNNTHFKVDLVPKTCCHLTNDDPTEPHVANWVTCKQEASQDKVTDPTQLWDQGCYSGLVEWLDHKAVILIGVAVGLALIQILGIVFACCVRKEVTSGAKYA